MAMRAFLALLLVAPSALAATLHGVVYSSEGEPIAKASIRAYRVEPSRDAMARLVAGTERKPVASAESGDNGTFTLDGKADGVYEIVVTKDGLAPHAHYELAGDDAILIAMKPADAHPQRVMAGGKPVAEARVIAWSQSSPVWSTRTDANGAYALPDLSQCCRAVTIVHRDFAVEMFAITDQRRGDITLDAGITVAGKVVDASGKPIAKASILQNGWPLATSADDGTFTVSHVRSKNSIVATSGALRGNGASANGVVIRVEPSRTITGSVRDASKNPIAGAPVVAYVNTQIDSDSALAVANEKGEFVIDGLGARLYGVWALAGDDVTFTPQDAKLQSKPTAHVNFVAASSTTLTGIVRDEQKHPIAGALVRLMATQEPVMYLLVGGRPTAMTGPDGRFRLQIRGHERSELGSFRLGAMHPQFAAATSETFKLDEKQKLPSVTITLRRGIELNGLVVDGDDKPVAGASIALVEDSPGLEAWPVDVAMMQGMVSPFIRTSADGKFTLHLNDAPHDVSIWKEGFAPARLGAVDPKSGKLLHVVLRPGVVIRGRIASAIPPESNIFASSSESAYLQGTIDPATRTFVITNLIEGTYTLTLSAGALQATKEVKAPATDVVIELPVSGELRGRATDKATGAAVPNVSITVASSENDFRPGFLIGESDGTFHGQVGLGPQRLTVSAEDYLPQTTTVEIQAGKPTDVAFALSRGRRIRGRVTSSDGRPIADAQIRLDDTTSEPHDMPASDERGDYELTVVPTEAVTINVARPGYQSRTIAVDAGDGDRTLDIVLSAGRRAVGRVVDENGAAVEGAEVTAYPTAYGGDYQTATTDAAGNFLIEGLGDGRHNVRATKPRVGSTTMNDVDVAGGPILITLRSAAASGTIHGVVKGYTEGRWMMGMIAVQTVAEDYDRFVSGQVARDGTFTIEDAPSGEVWVKASFMSMGREASAPRVKVTVPPGGEAAATIVIRNDVVVRGVVRESGQPVSGRRVSFSNGEGDWATTSGAGGAYEIAGIEPGQYNVAVDSGDRSFQTKHAVSSSETYDIDVAFMTIRGRVLDDANTPLGGVAIRTEDVNEDNTMTDGAGNFALHVSGNAARTITASKDGYAHGTVAAEPNGPPIVIRLPRSEGLRVRVVDARDGATLNGYVVAIDAQGAHIRGDEDSKHDGTAHVSLAPGAYRIAASAGNYASQSVRANVPMSGELRIALTPGGTLIVQADRESHDLIRLVLPNGEEYVRCHCNGIAEIRLDGQTTTIDHVAPGSYAMQVHDANGKVKATWPVTIGEGQVTTAAIKLPSD